MPTAAVVHRSRTGTTRRYAEAIAAHLRTLGVEARACSIADCDPADLAAVDLVLLGCWTNGWFVIHQHPDAPWVSFARDLPDLSGVRVGLFTTYKLVVGTMFARMGEALAPSGASVTVELASRNGSLGDRDRSALEAWAGALSASDRHTAAAPHA